ncbi:MAG TPA: helical backbone metal receptor [Burkholderiales bacterium]|nr:helical backbone metal receptor [Burkholderiales bacterium]
MSAQVVDAAGVRHVPAPGTPRIVSLVPSITELLCDLGLAPALVGRTGFCIHPREKVRAVPKVGGTKDVDIAKVRALAPSHVILNVDENRREDARALRDFVPALIVTHPLAPLDNLALYRLMGRIFRREREAEGLCRRFESAYSALEAAAEGFSFERVLYLVWKDPWMTVSRNTYVSRMLALVKWETVPEDAADRYPKVAFEDDALAGAGTVLLSSEPYRFREAHIAQVRGLLPRAGRVALIDGEMTAWYGSRAIAALDYLPRFRKALAT